MKRTIHLIKIFFLLAILTTSTLNAQEWNWGDQVDLAKEQYVLFSDAVKSKNYQSALKPLAWLLKNTPDLNPAIYINGVKVYENVAKKEGNAELKDQYIQRGLQLFDERIKYFNKKADVLGRKARFAYTFYNKTKSQYKYVFNVLKESFEINKKESGAGNLVAYMNMAYKHRLINKALSDDDIIDIYSSVSEALNYQKAKAGQARKARYDNMLGQLDKLLTATKVQISCEFVETKLGPKMKQDKDVNLAKKIFHLMILAKCIDRPLASDAAKLIQSSEPTYGVAKFLANVNRKKNNHQTAIKYYKNAASLTKDNSEKAEMYIGVAKVHMELKRKSDARNSARRALSYHSSIKGEANKIIGDLYMNSFNDCKQEKSQIDDRAIFIAAYKEYEKAGYTQGMKNAKSQFPSIEDIFTEGKKEGDLITVGCWINTTVHLERRPSSK